MFVFIHTKIIIKRKKKRTSNENKFANTAQWVIFTVKKQKCSCADNRKLFAIDDDDDFFSRFSLKGFVFVYFVFGNIKFLDEH